MKANATLGHPRKSPATAHRTGTNAAPARNTPRPTPARNQRPARNATPARNG